MNDLKDGGIIVDNLIYIANNAHIITDEHIEEDRKDETIGTTKRGVGQAYRDKYNRNGLRAENVEKLQPYLIDMYEEFYDPKQMCRILFEGAQGFGLDIDWGDYPYVTSSGCTVAAAIANGVPARRIRNVWGVAKAYETYVGMKKFQPDEEVFNRIREVGAEYGATTGRPRQCNWIDVNNLLKAVQINGVNKIVFNKVDVLRDIGQFKIYDENGFIVQFKNEEEMASWFLKKLPSDVKEIYWSGSPSEI